MDRREFMSWAGTGFIAASLPIAIAACSPAANEQTDTTVNSSTDSKSEDAAQVAKAPDAEGFVAMGTVADLDAAGFWRIRISPGGR